MQITRINLQKIIFFGTILLGLLLFFQLSPKTYALTGSNFNPGRIIDNAVFYNSNSMTVQQIQTFLDAKVPSCDTQGLLLSSNTKPDGSHYTRAEWGALNGNPIPFTCLKDYTQNVPAVVNGGSDLCTKSITSGTKNAARIIYDVAQACSINPKVLIVLLQKEQSLVTDDWPWNVQYQRATGYGCPDTAPSCNSLYFGFFNQVYNAAKAFRRYETNPTLFNYQVAKNNTIYYNPNLACGSSTVFIENQATASLYIYTPYQPNQAALSNLYGTGDGCSSYGNRNFWRLFNDWFGSTQLDCSTSDVVGGVSRLYNPFSRDYIYTSNSIEICLASTYYGYLNDGYAISTVSKVSAGAIPVYRLSGSRGDHFYTTSIAERDAAITSVGYVNEGIAFYSPPNGATTVPVYRLRTPWGSHFYTTSIAERDYLVNNTSYIYEGIAFRVVTRPSTDSIPVYRLWGVNHILTPSLMERLALISMGFKNENVSFYAPQLGTPGTKSIYRLYRPSDGDHLLTQYEEEKNTAVSHYGYIYEGVTFAAY